MKRITGWGWFLYRIWSIVSGEYIYWVYCSDCYWVGQLWRWWGSYYNYEKNLLNTYNGFTCPDCGGHRFGLKSEDVHLFISAKKLEKRLEEYLK